LDYQNAVIVRAVEQFDQRVFGTKVNGLNRGDFHSLLFRLPGGIIERVSEASEGASSQSERIIRKTGAETKAGIA
jgi:hypothetical protein